MRNDVITIIVTYNPPWDKVLERIKSFSVSTAVFVSDNSDHDSSQLFDLQNVTYHFNSGNVGIAKAQNIGVEHAIQHQYEYVAFVDDDSNFSGEQIVKLVDNYTLLGVTGRNIAAYCACPNEKGGLDDRIKSKLSNHIFITNNLMSSGSLTRTEVFKDVGLFKERLFIDFVDYEWGWRALDKNYLIVIDSSVQFEHSLGQGRLGIFLGIPSPIRHFYQTRNLLWILRLKYVPISWKIKQLMLLPVRFIYFGLIYKQSGLRRANFIKGLAAGIKSEL